MVVGSREGVAVRAASTLDLRCAAGLHAAELGDDFFEDGATGFYRSLGWAVAGQVRDVDGNAFDRVQLEL